MPPVIGLRAGRAASCKAKTYARRIARAHEARHCARSMAFAARGTRRVGLKKMPTWREIRGAYGRGRRALRQAMLEPVLVGCPVLRDIVMDALAPRVHLA